MGLRPTQGDEKNASVQQPLSIEPWPFPLSSRPGFPAARHWTRLRARLSLKERRMRSVNATNFHRKFRGSEAEGSAVRRTFRGNVFRPSVATVFRFAVPCPSPPGRLPSARRARHNGRHPTGRNAGPARRSVRESHRGAQRALRRKADRHIANGRRAKRGSALR